MKMKISGREKIRRLLWLALAVFFLCGCSIQNVGALAYLSMGVQPYATVASPLVILEEGTAGSSTIYTNSTSAKASVAAPESTNTEDYVDLLSDVDNSADIGTHGNFTAQQYGPDLINDTLTEQDVGSYLIIRPNAVGAKSDWNPVGSTNNWECTDEATPDEDTTFVNTTAKSKKDFYNLQDHTTETGSISNVGLYVRAKGDAGAELILRVRVNGTEYPGQTCVLTTSYTDYYDDWATNPAGGNWTWSDIDALEAGFMSSPSSEVEQKVTHLYVNVTQDIQNYELDLEVQWTSVDYDETNEYLCIYGGAMGSENITVAAWNGTAWNNLLADLSSGWNNASVSSYLTSSNFTIRFKGANETNDVSQDSWNIDAAILHLWTDAASTYDYVLKVNNTVTDSWEIRLKKFSDSSIARLKNCTIYFRNSTNDNSTQIVIENGSLSQTEGAWYDLNNSEIIYIAMTVEASSTGTSYVYTYLEIRYPDTTTYAQYEIAFEIT